MLLNPFQLLVANKKRLVLKTRAHLKFYPIKDFYSYTCICALVGRPKLRYKDTCKSVLKTVNILERWQNMVEDRPLWRRAIVDVCGRLNVKRIVS